MLFVLQVDWNITDGACYKLLWNDAKTGQLNCASKRRSGGGSRVIGKPELQSIKTSHCASYLAVKKAHPAFKRPTFIWRRFLRGKTPINHKYYITYFGRTAQRTGQRPNNNVLGYKTVQSDMENFVCAYQKSRKSFIEITQVEQKYGCHTPKNGWLLDMFHIIKSKC